MLNLEEAARRVGIVQITEVLSNRPVVRGIRQTDLGAPKEYLVLKVTGASLKGEGPAYEVWNEQGLGDGRPPECIGYENDTKGVDGTTFSYMATRQIEGRHPKDRNVGLPGESLRTDHEMTKALIDALVSIKAIGVSSERAHLFRTWQELVGVQIEQTKQALEDPMIVEKFRQVEPAFRNVLSNLDKQRFLIHGDCKAGNAIITPTGKIVYFDPMGTLGPAGWNAAQLIAESAQDDISEIAPLVKRAVEKTGVSEKEIYACIGVIEVLMAGYGVANIRTAQRAGKDLSEIVGPTPMQRMETATECFSRARELAQEPPARDALVA